LVTGYKERWIWVTPELPRFLAYIRADLGFIWT
jgi:hypothetical protein